jgi:hypothetical protein
MQHSQAAAGKAPLVATFEIARTHFLRRIGMDRGTPAVTVRRLA